MFKKNLSLLLATTAATFGMNVQPLVLETSPGYDPRWRPSTKSKRKGRQTPLKRNMLHVSKRTRRKHRRAA